MSNSKPQARILIVDDEKDIAAIIKRGLEKNGFEARAYSDPSAALEHFAQNSREYCVVLSDIRMPQVTGFQLTREIRKINPDVKIVLMSSFDIGSEFSDVFSSIKVDDFITKPARIATVRNVLSKHISMTKSLANSGEKKNP
jgi:DNA-binding response OmpR family regulator